MADSLLYNTPQYTLDSLLGIDRSAVEDYTDRRWHEASAEELYGVSSTVVPHGEVVHSRGVVLTDNALFQGFVLLLAAAYATLLYRNLGEVAALSGRITRNAASGKQLSEASGGSGFSRFMNIVAAVGVLFVGIAVVKYSDMMVPQSMLARLPEAAVLGMSLVGSVLGVAVVLYQWAVLRLIGYVTLREELVDRVLFTKRLFFSLGVIAMSPALLLFALCPAGEGGVWFFVIAVELIVALILYLRELLNLFLQKKISILHWFLYLCGVEILPLSLLWFLMMRESA